MSDPLGLESGVVRVVDYDQRWPALFAAERQRILEACGPLAISVEHAGSTSIPGMCAKPILDTVAGRSPGSVKDEYIAAIVRAGYIHRGEQGVPGREFFRRGELRSYHLHLVEEGSVLWRDYLDFRDYLRAHPDATREFGQFKRELAAQFPTDRESYIEGKTERVRGILALARPNRG